MARRAAAARRPRLAWRARVVMVRGMRIALAHVALLAALPAQTTLYAPFRTATTEGNRSASFPFAFAAGTYQQVHDREDMANVIGAGSRLLTGMVFRKDGTNTGTVAARTLTVSISVGHTAVNSAGMTTGFTANTTTALQVALPTTTLNLPALNQIATPNPAGWTIPWTTPFAYVATPGNNLLWEWRHTSSARGGGALDAASSSTATVNPNEGTGCVASGQSSPASISLSALVMSTQSYQQTLSRGAAARPAVFLLGVQRGTFTLPGACASLRTAPLIDAPGSTDGAGTWALNLPTPDLRGTPSVELLGQFVFLDSGYAVGLALSDMSSIVTPVAGAHRLSSTWHDSDAAATTGNGLALRFGLVTGFTTP